MRAVLCKQFGPVEDLVVEEVPDPTPGPGEVVVDVAGCGVNFPDVLIIQDKYQFKPELPFSPGGEIAGTVSAVGEGVDGLQVGDAVLATLGWGGMAEKVAVSAASAIPVPPGVDLVQASGFLLAHGTSHHALVDRAHLQSGETLLVLGAAGGVGLAAVELGALLGARVIAAASTDEKLELCRAKGAAETINYSTEDLRGRIKELTDGKGIDVCYDPVGGDLSEPALRSMAWDGRFLVVGFAAGDIPKVPLNLPLLKGCSVVGVFWGAFTGKEPERNKANIAELLGWLAEGKLDPHVSATYPLDQAVQAINDLAERRATGKVVVTP
ncbi:MAG TPA: NADPH:quinone oxidoreductase family protein [Acidimicrobiales bacterium]|nr:NADPH:quinone oxidoreductase family protein [Acidimicrobiales bacterium]